MKKKKCSQKQQFASKNFNEIFKLLYFYHYIFFDNTGEMLEEAQRLGKTRIMKLKEAISQFEKNEKQLRRQVEKFESVLDETENKDEIKILARRISETENKLKENYDSLAKSKIELTQLQGQYSENEAMNLHTNAKEKVLNFFKANTEEQRNNLIAIIKKCLIFSPYLLIDTGSTIFVFDTTSKHVFDETLLDGLEQDAIYKEHFIGLFNDDEDYIENAERTETIKENIFNPSGISLLEYSLENAADKKSVLKLFKAGSIKYDIENHKSVVFDLPETLE